MRAALVVCLLLSGCAFAIPVRAVPTDEPILVAPVGTMTLDDAITILNGNLPQPDPAKFPPAKNVTAGWPMLGNLLLAAVGALTGGGGIMAVVLPMLRKSKVALSIASSLADANAAANTDAEVATNKRNAAMAQEAAGVRKLTQRARGKA